MDLSAYAALGGMERVAIIVGALVIGYWGYRLYGRDRKPGLVFMGVACAVLIAALATGGSYLRSVGTSYQLAGAGQEGSTQQSPADRAPAEKTVQDQLETSSEEASRRLAGEAPAPGEPESVGSSETSSADSVADPAGDAAIAAAGGQQNAAPEPKPSASDDVDGIDAANAMATIEPDLASSEELGGRITSVKSANVTLEWSRD